MSSVGCSVLCPVAASVSSEATTTGSWHHNDKCYSLLHNQADQNVKLLKIKKHFWVKWIHSSKVTQYPSVIHPYAWQMTVWYCHMDQLNPVCSRVEEGKEITQICSNSRDVLMIRKEFNIMSREMVVGMRMVRGQCQRWRSEWPSSKNGSDYSYSCYKWCHLTGLVGIVMSWSVIGSQVCYQF